MNNSSCVLKCKCEKKVRNIEFTNYEYDPECLTNQMKNTFKTPLSFQKRGACESAESSLKVKLDYKSKCKCMKKVQNIEFTIYEYDSECLANQMKNTFQTSQTFQKSGACEFAEPSLKVKFLKSTLNSVKENKIDESKYKLKPINDCQTKPILIKTLSQGQCSKCLIKTNHSSTELCNKTIQCVCNKKSQTKNVC